MEEDDPASHVDCAGSPVATCSPRSGSDGVDTDCNPYDGGVGLQTTDDESEVSETKANGEEVDCKKCDTDSDSGKRVVSDDLDRRINKLLISLSTEDSPFGAQLTDSPLSPTSPTDDHEFRVANFQKIRSSSLKCATKKDITPSRKKVVRFADALGLDLASIRHIVRAEMPPHIPARIMVPLRQSAALFDPHRNVDPASKYLTANFSQPGASFGFLDRVHEKKVCLENCIITDRTLSCTVRVANIGFHKTVLVRYTLDGWKTRQDINAMYIRGSCDGPTDRYIFSLVVPADMEIGARVEVAILYIVNGESYWDNNYGVNYRVEMYMTASLHNDDLMSFL